MDLPHFTPVRRSLPRAPLADPAAALLAGLGERARSCHGKNVAVAVGSRGIAGQGEVLIALLGALRAAGARPFIVPAMGSHGGGEAAGQAALLERRGLGEGALGVPVLRDDAPVLLADGLPFSRAALRADVIVPVNRVRRHTILEGEQGSGLQKMTVVGLGLAAGATAAHAAGLENLDRRFAALRAQVPLGWGVALVEDGAGNLSVVEVADAASFAATDRRLLQVARRFAPGTGFPQVDALVLIFMGKEISGAGMDPDVIGRHRRRGEPGPPGAPWIGALRLSPQSAGNAIGVGMADMVSRPLQAAVDEAATAANAAASGWSAGAVMPPVASCDADLLRRACRRPGGRVILYRDTARLERCLVSPALAAAARGRPDLEITGPARALPLDGHGMLRTTLLDRSGG